MRRYGALGAARPQRAIDQVYSIIPRIAVSSLQHCYLSLPTHSHVPVVRNAFIVLHALGGSTSDVHLPAIAGRMPEPGLISSGGTALDDINWIDRKVSMLVVVRQNGWGTWRNLISRLVEGRLLQLANSRLPGVFLAGNCRATQNVAHGPAHLRSALHIPCSSC